VKNGACSDDSVVAGDDCGHISRHLRSFEIPFKFESNDSD